MQSYSYISRAGGTLSQMLNVFVFNGHPNESLSARSHREYHEDPENTWYSVRRSFINLLFFWQDDHCARAHHLDYVWAWERVSMYPEKGKRLFCGPTPLNRNKY